MRRVGPAPLIALALVAATAACGSTAPTPTVGAPSGPPVTPVITATPPSPAPPATTSPGAGPGGVIEDPSLLAVLPAAVDGVQVVLESRAFAEAAADPSFARNVRRAAFGVAVADADLVSGVVAELAPGRYTDAFFRDWRDTYNDGACSQAGGVIGNAETEIAGRTVYIASCQGGLRAYHAWLPERGAIVSAFALGERRLGEALMEGLRP